MPKTNDSWSLLSVDRIFKIKIKIENESILITGVNSPHLINGLTKSNKEIINKKIII